VNDLLKEELGFPGYVMSDWNAQHTGVNSALAGLDTGAESDLRVALVLTKKIPRCQDSCCHIIKAGLRNGWNGGKATVDVTADHASVVRTVARDSIVLLKNQEHALPPCMVCCDIDSCFAAIPGAECDLRVALVLTKKIPRLP
jgi:beta-glucosidase